MPRIEHGATTHHVPGVYDYFRRVALAQAARPDPRTVTGDEELERPGPKRDKAIRANVRNQPRRQRCSLDVDKLDACEPVEIPHWYFGGGDSGPDCGPTWQEWPSVATYVMTADDFVMPLR